MGLKAVFLIRCIYTLTLRSVKARTIGKHKPHTRKRFSHMEDHCLFCNIAGGCTDTRFVFENEHVVVFKDIHPQAPVHLLAVPKKHIRSINDLTDKDRIIVAELIDVARLVAKQQGIGKSGYKLVFNVESGGGQVIFHLHLHLIGGW